MPLACPSCHEIIDESAFTATGCACPHCGQRLSGPSGLRVSGYLLPQESAGPPPVMIHSRPSFVVVNTREPRLKSGGWFSRAFSTAGGVLTAVLLFGAVVAGIPTVLLCGGFAATVNKAASSVRNERQQLTGNSRKMALPQLKRFGVVQVSEEAIASSSDDGYVLFQGMGRLHDGRMCDFQVLFRVATFGKTNSWEIQSVKVDGDYKYTRPR